MMCLQGMADLERLEGPWLDGMTTGDPERTGVAMRLLLAHLNWNSKRLLGAMVLDRLDAGSVPIQRNPDLLSRDVTQP